MASGRTDGDGLLWSNDTFSISQVVELFQLPCLVRVSEGIYSEYDTECFSTGDCLKLHSFQRIEKVVAYPVTTTQTNSIPRDFSKSGFPLLIPLDYSSKARVLRAGTLGRRKRYPTVQMLIEDFPATVQVGAKSIVGIHVLTGCNIEISAKSTLQLLNKSKDMANKRVSLICRYKDQDVILPPDCAGDFSELADDIQGNTIRDIIKSFQLPQLIEFSQNFSQEGKYVTQEANSALANISQFTGRFVLDRIHVDRKVFGSHRLDLNSLLDGSTLDTYRKHRAVVLISWDSDAEFQIAENMDTSDYQSVISMNFLKDVTVPQLGGFYIDIADNCKSQTVDADNYSYPDLNLLNFSNFTNLGVSKDPASPEPPERPPRRGIETSASLNHTASSLPRTIDRPTVLPKPSLNPDYLVPIIDSDYEIVTDDMIMPPKEIVVPSRTIPSIGKSPEINPTKIAPERLHNYMDRCQVDSNISDTNPQQGVNVCSPTLVNVKQKEKIPPQVAPKRNRSIVKKQQAIVQPTTAPKQSMDVSPILNKNKESRTTGDNESPPLQSQQDKLKESNQHGGPWLEILKTLSVEKVTDCLRQLGFGQKCDVFSGQRIDGDYLISLFQSEPDTLTKEPFSLTSIEMLKLRKFIESGKLPLLDTGDTILTMKT